ncbi:lipopolysaccharide biosynthesis protein [Marinilongibacter aquaticus]|uniref:GumC family protein n=1 Tax=Marinilongibacter aquaticus TaxID=2975157 RepID=UPI0021BD9A6C|nr:lipopolysaccharide biosynthesis protein [Marinilongibacter aquaticus]UBM60734.1 lipopolysaccharide biosynthesis protein [Marinilongibacter aquaticus]
MKELLFLLRFLKRRVLIILGAMLAAMVCAYFLTRQLPDTYRSKGRLATGFVDKTDQMIPNENSEGDAEINRKFDNIIQLIRLKKVVDRVSYRLLMHDLKAPADSLFSENATVIEKLSAAEKDNYYKTVKQKYDQQYELSQWNADDRKLLGLIGALNFDYEHIDDKLQISRLASSDYISIENEANNSVMAAFVINALTEEFLAVYAARLKDSNNRSLEFFANMMKEKLNALNAIMEQLKQYKIKNKVLNLNEQARSLYGHIIDFETRREVAKKDVVALKAAIANIDQRFDPADRKFLENKLTEVNREIAADKEEIRALNRAYINSNFDPALGKRLDSLQSQLTKQIQVSSDQYIYNPLNAKNDLINRKLELEIELELAENSITTIEAEVNRLNRKYEGMVPNEASIQQYETSIDIAGKEYIEALQRYNNAILESYSPITIKQVQKAMPGNLVPSKKNMYILIAGMAAMMLCLIVFLILYLLDNSIRSPYQLAYVTGLPVLGRLNKIDVEGQRLLNLEYKVMNSKISKYNEMVQSIRYEVNHASKGKGKVISITGLKESTSKSDMVYGLAWAFSRTHKKVLIIDGLFEQGVISQESEPEKDLAELMKIRGKIATGNQEITIIGQSDSGLSLFELAPEEAIDETFANLSEQFDIILVDAPSLESENKAKEWFDYSRAVVCVYEFGKTVQDYDLAKIDYLKNRIEHFAGWVLVRTSLDVDPLGKPLAPLDI